MTKRAKRGIFIAVTLAGFPGLSVMAGCWASPKTEVQQLLSQAKLSPLPPSATNVVYYQWNGLFTGATYARFELSAGDLRAVISNSPSLQGIKPREIYNTNYQHVPFPPGGIPPYVPRVARYDYFSQDRMSPNWYDLTIRGRGRKYIIDWGPNMMILIDEDRCIVWLHLVKG